MKLVLIVLAGPNGAGKSTFYESFLIEKGLPFINADILAREFQVGAYEAADIAQRLRVQLVEQKESFITETVFSDPVGAKLSFFKQAEESGYDVTLIYIGISSVQLSRTRVQKRKRAGGHGVPNEKLEGRYERSLQNLKTAVAKLTHVIVFDNSHFDKPFEIIAEFKSGNLTSKRIGSLPYWARDLVV